MKILVTGFEPFANEPINPAAEVAKRLVKPEGADFEARILPVSFARVEEALRRAILESGADVVLSLGQAGPRREITPEKVGINFATTRSSDGKRFMADDYGFSADDIPIVEDGPAAYFTNLPIRRMVAACNAAGVPCAVSYSAGTYVCNYTLYTLMRLAETDFAGLRADFIHLPYLPEQIERMRGSGVPVYSMELSQMVKGVQAIVDDLAKGGF